MTRILIVTTTPSMGLVRHAQGVLALVIPLEGVEVLVKWCRRRLILCRVRAWKRKMITFAQPVLKIVIANPGSVLDPWPPVQEARPTSIGRDRVLRMTIAIIPAIMVAMGVLATVGMYIMNAEAGVQEVEVGVNMVIVDVMCLAGATKAMALT